MCTLPEKFGVVNRGAEGVGPEVKTCRPGHRRCFTEGPVREFEEGGIRRHLGPKKLSPSSPQVLCDTLKRAN